MPTSKLKNCAAVLIASVGISGLLAQQVLVPEPGVSAEMAQTETKVAQIRELVRPQAGEHVTIMAKIAWEHDPWEAAVKAARSSKPVLAYGECMAGVPCG